METKVKIEIKEEEASEIYNEIEDTPNESFHFNCINEEEINQDNFENNEKNPKFCSNPNQFKIKNLSQNPYHSKGKICSVCGMEFKYLCGLTRHLLTHTGEKPFECKYCKNKFTQKGTLARHIKIIHHKIKSIK